MLPSKNKVGDEKKLFQRGKFSSATLFSGGSSLSFSSSKRFIRWNQNKITNMILQRLPVLCKFAWFVFIKRWESNFDLIFFRYLHHRRWIWTVQFNQSPILMPEASVTRILTTLLRVRQLEGFTFAHSKVCLCLY